MIEQKLDSDFWSVYWCNIVAHYKKYIILLYYNWIECCIKCMKFVALCLMQQFDIFSEYRFLSGVEFLTKPTIFKEKREALN